MKRKEEWIDDTLNSLEGMKKVSYPAGLTEKIMEKLSSTSVPPSRLKASLVWRVAATILILISLNILTEFFSGSGNSDGINTSNTKSEYLDYLAPFNF